MSDTSTIPTAATPDVCTAVILVGGQVVPDTLHLLSLTVSRELNRIPSASLQFDDGEAAKATFPASNSDLFVPGKAIEIQLGYRSQNETVFKGTIVKQHLKVRKSGGVLSVDCYADAVKLTAARKSHYFVGKKDSDIMEDILVAHAMSHDVEATLPNLDEVVQYDATDWDFVLCRAEANGQVVMVGDDRITIARPRMDGAPVLQMTYGATVLELDVEMDARWQSKGIKAVSWNAADQATVSADGSEPATPLAGNIGAADLARVLGDDTDEITHGGAIDQPQLQAWADARLMRMRLARLRGRARCQGFAGVLPGKIVQIGGIGARFEGKLYVSGVRHTLSGGNWETDVQFGLNPALFAETYNLRPLPAAGLLPSVLGLQIGVVTQLGNDPAGEDRIKCRLPLVSTSDDGIWARIATLDAGKGRGTYFRPEIGDEVVVGFLGQDPRFPVVLGQCNSSAKPSPEPARDDNNHKGYVSREKLKLTFDDEKKAISFETPAGNRIVLSEDGKSIVLQDENDNRITLDANGITIESAKDLVFKAAKDVKLSGMNAEFSAQSGFKATGTGTAELSGAQTKINGDATTVISGGMVRIN
ncbi:type VI secretion system tip protein VgrG [Burkholderia sp. Bp8963]|uniref:type VI secretion system tip protein VgrG n=1 Tax=Burkholderia sp. Bp8963 TaxID=2184547 RepID=UPI000F591300|nr:type VI secretion system tip protein VgrG [Burkholderia sp. Bp8963]RQS65779.1 type VI secretion system tip protein VgrG [Burkholderia sp. Bp8963]